MLGVSEVVCYKSVVTNISVLSPKPTLYLIKADFKALFKAELEIQKEELDQRELQGLI